MCTLSKEQSILSWETIFFRIKPLFRLRLLCQAPSVACGALVLYLEALECNTSSEKEA